MQAAEWIPALRFAAAGMTGRRSAEAPFQGEEHLMRGSNYDVTERTLMVSSARSARPSNHKGSGSRSQFISSVKTAGDG